MGGAEGELTDHGMNGQMERAMDGPWAGGGGRGLAGTKPQLTDLVAVPRPHGGHPGACIPGRQPLLSGSPRRPVPAPREPPASPGGGSSSPSAPSRNSTEAASFLLLRKKHFVLSFRCSARLGISVSSDCPVLGPWQTCLSPPSGQEGAPDPRGPAHRTLPSPAPNTAPGSSWTHLRGPGTSRHAGEPLVPSRGPEAAGPLTGSGSPAPHVP